MLARTVISTPTGLAAVTVEQIQTHFLLDGGVVKWRKPVSKRTRPNSPAGTLLRHPTEPKNYGFKVGFGSATLDAEEIAFTLHHGRFPKGKICHKDGDRTNNAPSNLLEIGG